MPSLHFAIFNIERVRLWTCSQREKEKREIVGEREGRERREREEGERGGRERREGEEGGRERGGRERREREEGGRERGGRERRERGGRESSYAVTTSCPGPCSSALPASGLYRMHFSFLIPPTTPRRPGNLGGKRRGLEHLLHPSG